MYHGPYLRVGNEKMKIFLYKTWRFRRQVAATESHVHLSSVLFSLYIYSSQHKKLLTVQLLKGVRERGGCYVLLNELCCMKLVTSIYNFEICRKCKKLVTSVFKLFQHLIFYVLETGCW
jgi:hypothetical protein